MEETCIIANKPENRQKSFLTNYSVKTDGFCLLLAQWASEGFLGKLLRKFKIQKYFKS